MEAASDAKYDAIAAEYDARYAGPYWELYDHVTLGTAAPYLPREGASVLDVGAGSGRYSLRFLAKGYRVTLLDPSREMLAVARRKVEAASLGARASYVVGSMESLDFPDAAFDFAFSEGDPLSYCLGAHEKAAREVVRVLRPGAAFYVSCDNRWIATLGHLLDGRAAEGFAAAERGVATDPYGSPVHAFTASELKGLFEAAGARDVLVAGKIGLAHFLAPDALASLAADESAKRRLYAVESALATDPTMAGLASHLHVVGRKP